MRQFFISVHLYQPKNKAHKEVQELASAYSRCLMDGRRVNGFKSMLKKAINQINEKHTRCQNIQLQERNYRNDGMIFISVEDNFQLTLTEVKRYDLATRNVYMVEHKPGEEKSFRVIDSPLNVAIDKTMAQPDGDLANYRIWQQVM